MIKLQAGDAVILRQGRIKKIRIIEGFSVMGMHTVSGITPFNRGIFYGCGYHDGAQVFTLLKNWHYYPARLCEWARVILPHKAGKFIFGF